MRKKPAGATRLASLQASFRVEEAGQALMPAPPRRPLHNQLEATGRREQQMCQQMTHFGNAQRQQIGGRVVALVSMMMLTRKLRLSSLVDTGGEFVKAQSRYTSGGDFAKIGEATDR